MNKSIWIRLSSVVLAGSVVLSACGSKSDELPVSSLTNSNSLAASATTNSQTATLLATLPKIMAGIDDIKARIQALEVSPIQETASAAPTPTRATSTSKTSTATVTRAPSKTPVAATPVKAPVKTPAKPAPTAADKGQAELLKVLNTFIAAGAVQATVEKVEKSLTTGDTVTNKLKLYTRKPNTVKIEVLQSNKSPAGTKILYSSGVGDKVKVRPSGALSFVTTDLAKNDERIISINKFPLDSSDFFGATQRFSTGYKATLIGTMSLSGQKINVLKVTASSGTNSLDPRIDYEHIGYDPQTYAIRMMEMYDKSGSKEPFFRIVLPSIEYLDALPESTFKL
jgi:hypothetical protein